MGLSSSFKGDCKGNQCDDQIVDKNIGTSYDVVRTVYDALPWLYENKDVIENGESYWTDISNWHSEIEVWYNQIEIWYNEIVVMHSDVQGWHSDVDGWHEDIGGTDRTGETDGWRYEVKTWHADVQGWHSDVDMWHSDVSGWHLDIGGSDRTGLTDGWYKETKDNRDAADASASAAAQSETNAYNSELKARDWAIKDDGFVEGTDYSAKHHADEAGQYAAIAELWAQEDEDVEVTAGQYSSYHWAQKSEEEADRSKDEADRAQSIADNLDGIIRSKGYFDPAQGSYPLPDDEEPTMWTSTGTGTVDGTNWTEGDLLYYVPDAQQTQGGGSYYRVAGELAAGGTPQPLEINDDLVMQQGKRILFRRNDTNDPMEVLQLSNDDDIIIGDTDPQAAAVKVAIVSQNAPIYQVKSTNEQYEILASIGGQTVNGSMDFDGGGVNVRNSAEAEGFQAIFSMDWYSDGGTQYPVIKVGGTASSVTRDHDILIHGADDVERARVTTNGDLKAVRYVEDESGRVYSPGNKPTPADIGAVAKSGDTMSDKLTISNANYGQHLSLVLGSEEWAFKPSSDGSLDITRETGTGTAWIDVPGLRVDSNPVYHAGNNNIGTGAANYAAGNHDHDGTYAPESHTHTNSEVGLGNVDNVRQYSASNTNIGTGATNYAAGNHTHDYAPSSHTHTNTEVGLGNVDNIKQYSAQNTNIGTGSTNYAAGDHTHDYAPSSHNHAWDDITGKPATATRWPSWSEVTSKPSTFTPSSHTHTKAEAGLGSVDNARQMRATNANGYWGLTDAEGSTSAYIRVPSSGLLPYSASSSAGVSRLGTSSWRFEYIYAANYYATTDFHVTSDIKVKENLRPITDCLDRIDHLTPYLFDRMDTGDKDVAGLIAQDVKKALSQGVTKDEELNQLLIKQMAVIAVLTGAVKELKAEVRKPWYVKLLEAVWPQR